MKMFYSKMQMAKLQRQDFDVLQCVSLCTGCGLNRENKMKNYVFFM